MAATDRPKITGIILHDNWCAAHEYCTLACPEVFNTTSGVVSLNDLTEQYFDSKIGAILEAEACCPVGAIEVMTDPPRPSPPPQTGRYPDGLSMRERLRFARDEVRRAQGLGAGPGDADRKPWWRFW